MGNQSRQNQNDPNNSNQQGQNNQRRHIRPQQKVAFEIPHRTETEIRTTLQTRFEGLTSNPALRGVAFDMNSEGIVTLRGEVATVSARQLAANLVRLEPGVRKVVNELTVP
jgi:osmotically-inducible protein OsmY